MWRIIWNVWSPFLWTYKEMFPCLEKLTQSIKVPCLHVVLNHIGLVLFVEKWPELRDGLKWCRRVFPFCKQRAPFSVYVYKRWCCQVQTVACYYSQPRIRTTTYEGKEELSAYVPCVLYGCVCYDAKLIQKILIFYTVVFRHIYNKCITFYRKSNKP